MTGATATLRNIAIIAHVDHGKTTLVDQLLRQSGTLSAFKEFQERVMDSNELERERGITILAKNTSLQWKDWRINIVDTPGHADFGGEVERVLSMADSVLLLVDAVDGPMPQTRFVTQKALALGLCPIVVINKVDRPNARADWALDQTFDLFDRLGATHAQLDFPVVYASALQGWATLDLKQPASNMDVLFQTIVDHVPPPDVNVEGPLQLQVSALSYSSYVGVIGIGRIQRGRVQKNMPVAVIDAKGEVRKGRILQIFRFHGLEKIEMPDAEAGQIVSFTGLERLHISDTVCAPDMVEALPPLKVDEPTITMTFQVNDSPFAGQEGKYVTSRNLRERLERELLHNVALRVEMPEDADKFIVSGRGELHLSILVENMRREGFELAISRPKVIVKTVDGVECEPWETLAIDVPLEHQGGVMEALGSRRGEIKAMNPDGKERVRLEYLIPSRGLIGLRPEFLTLTSGAGLIYHAFSHYGPRAPGAIGERVNGVLVSMASGKALAYALFNLQERGRLFVAPGDVVYEGQIVGESSRDGDMVVNPLKGKKLTNIRTQSKDENVLLTPPIRMSLEQAMEFIADDELVEVTPKNIRIRKRHLTEGARKRAERVA
jgi:GTP-binding protein